jgi:uncharacterized protein YkwD
MPSKRLLPTLIITLLIVSACTQTVPGTATPVDTKSPRTETAAPVQTENTATEKAATAESKSPTTKTVTPAGTQDQTTETAIPTATSTTSERQTQSNCSDSASFVADVTIPDNSILSQGKTFEKTWRIRNTGTCSWNENYSMVFVNGDQLNSTASIPFKATAPGATLDVSVNLVAPSVDGVYTGNYELHNTAGQFFLIDNTRLIWVKIIVGTGVTQKQAPVARTSTETQAPVAGTSGGCAFFEDSGIERTLISLINAVRADNGLQALAFNKKLSGAAIGHSIDMACHSTISHTDSNGSGITDRFNANGYSYTYWNEAIYAQPPEYGGNAQSAVDWWLNDPPHRVILLSPDAKDIGAGYAYVSGSKLGGYFTIDVGAPAP